MHKEKHCGASVCECSRNKDPLLGGEKSTHKVLCAIGVLKEQTRLSQRQSQGERKKLLKQNWLHTAPDRPTNSWRAQKKTEPLSAEWPAGGGVKEMVPVREECEAENKNGDDGCDSPAAIRDRPGKVGEKPTSREAAHENPPERGGGPETKLYADLARGYLHGLLDAVGSIDDRFVPVDPRPPLRPIRV